MSTAADDVVVCEPLRTPVGRYGGALRPLGAADLGAQLLAALLKRTSLPVDAVDDVILGHSYPSPEAPGVGAVEAQEIGVFADEIVPLTVPGRRGEQVVSADEHDPEPLSSR